MAAARSGKLKKWEYPKNSGIWIREILSTKSVGGKDKTYSAYLVTVPSKVTDSGRKRKQFQSKGDAERWASDQLRGARKQGEDYFKATDAERREFVSWLPRLRESGVSLTEALEFAMKRLRPEGGERTVDQIAQELIESKKLRSERGDIRERSFKDFKNRVSKFAEAFEGLPAKELELTSIVDWLKELELKPRTIKNYLAVISEVLNEAHQRKYIAENPLVSLTTGQRKELVGSESDVINVSILTPDQARRLLEGALKHPDLGLLGAVTLGLFCGIRVGELLSLDWEFVDIESDRSEVTVPFEIAKKRRNRHVDIPANALSWIASIHDRKGKLVKVNNHEAYRIRFNKLLKLSGFGKKDKSGNWLSGWETNAMRHSFGSYHYALHNNSFETAKQLGHKANDQVLFDHYHRLVKKKDAEAFFSIEPPKSKSKLVEFAG